MKRFLKYDTEITKKENSPVDKNGLIKENIVGGGGVQPDWNQNDSTQPDYVKNRPFYTGDPVETVLVEENTVSFIDDGGMYMAELPSTFEATVGETYKVSWDGSDYECTCVDFKGNLTIGNLSIPGAGSDTGEPFLMGINNGAAIRIIAADTSASHTFSISRLATEVVKIDKKYLVQPDWNQNDSTQPDYVKNRPFYMGDPVETVLVEESTVEFVENNGLYGTRFPSTFEATVGETYKVYWDGTTYGCACVDFNDIPAIGNLSIPGAGSDTGEPFVMQVKNGASITIVAADTAAFHTFSISRLATEAVKIDPKYLPDTIATKSEVEAAQTTASNAQTTASNAQTTASNAQTTASNAQTAANNAKSEALDLAARMFGHTSVVDKAFYQNSTLSITSLPACIKSIGEDAFNNCNNLALTSLPSGLTSIGNNAFFSCYKLAITSLPSGLTSIGDSAFANCKKIILTSLPSGLTSIGGFAFSCCTGLTSLTFEGTPTTIDSSAFVGCTKLITINVPWAEGEVANAPWGATNATINYNYTEA